MQLEVGSIVEGKVTGVTRFGVFVMLEPHTTGLVHISEISNNYVTEIGDYVKEGDTVKVKILNIDGNKIGLSMKQALPKTNPSATEKASSNHNKPHHPHSTHQKPLVFHGIPKKEEPTNFEDMLARFKQNSEEKMSDIKRNMDGKRGSYSRKR